jgi:hypothetical protein
MDKIDIPEVENTHTRIEGLGTHWNPTTEDIQDFIDKDYSWATAGPLSYAKVSDRQVDDLIDNIETMITEPDWTPDC